MILKEFQIFKVKEIEEILLIIYVHIYLMEIQKMQKKVFITFY